MTVRPVFPAAAGGAGDEHPRNCPCLECIDKLIAECSRPLVEPAPRVDPALLVPPPRVRPDWSGRNRRACYCYAPARHGHHCAPDPVDQVRGTRGPGGGGGRRPTGPGRRRRSSSGTPDGPAPWPCGLVIAAIAAYTVALSVLGVFAYWAFAG